MNPSFIRNTIISGGTHVAVLYVLLALSLFSCGHRRPMETAFLVDFQPGPPGPPASTLHLPEPTPEPESVPAPEPVSESQQDRPESVPKPKPEPRKIKTSTNLVRRAASKPAPTRARTPGKPAAKPLTAAQIRAALATALPSAGPAESGTGFGTGTGGAATPYGWYLTLIRTILYDAWQQPPSALAGRAGLVTRVVLRVRADGEILGKRMDASSGNRLMDASVMAALESVTRLPELPYGFGGATKDITVDFVLEAEAP